MKIRKQVIVLLLVFFSMPSLVLAKTQKYTFDNKVALNGVSLTIDAPIETTRAQLDGIRGELEVDAEDLTKTRGAIDVDLLTITSHSFADETKNATQTEHMRNWFEIGPDVSKKIREKNQWARFTIKEISKVEAQKLADREVFSDEIGTGRAYKITAEGDLTIHGVTKPKTADLNVLVYEVNPKGNRYPEAGGVVMIRTTRPLEVSLSEHDIKPRDTTGKFLAKAMSVVGLKIADDAQIQLDLRAFTPRSTESAKK